MSSADDTLAPRRGCHGSSRPPSAAWHSHESGDARAVAALGRWLAAHPRAPKVSPPHRDQFLAGRYCAALAIARLTGVPVGGSIARQADGQPLWPDGCVGSITHTNGFAAAAVAKVEDHLSLGIDSEALPGRTTALEIETQVLSPGEATLLKDHGLAKEEAVFLAFSAKESLYKCLHPLAGRFFAFRDAELAKVDLERGELDIRLLTGLGDRLQAGASFQGRLSFEHGRVHTSVFLTAGKLPAT